MDQVRFAQFLLFRQADHLKEYAQAQGVNLIGDLPFFVSPDSSDVWANPELFLLDEHRRPRFVAGVPPDYFSADGQLWGNPVYNWDALRSTGYRWCIERLRALLCHVDVIRLDHFRGFAAAWHVPAGATTAQSGQWVQGPGALFLEAVRNELGRLPFIVEDLGVITPDVQALRDQFQLPGTRVLQFAFDGNPSNPYLPHNIPDNAVVYTGTHDNAPTREWYGDLPDSQRQNLWSYLKRAPGGNAGAAPALLHLAWSSPAVLAIAARPAVAFSLRMATQSDRKHKALWPRNGQPAIRNCGHSGKDRMTGYWLDFDDTDAFDRLYHSLRPDRNPQLADAIGQRGAFHSQPDRCPVRPSGHPIRFSQCAQHVFALHLFEGAEASGRSLGRRLFQLLQRGAEGGPRGENHRPLYKILQFSHIAGPRIVCQ